MAIEKFTFLDEVGVQKLAEALLTKANIRISERIVQEINDSSDANHVASAALLNTLLKAADAKIASNTAAIGANTTAIGAANTSITELGEKVDTNKTSIDTVNSTLSTLAEKVDGLTHLTITTVTGPITDITEPDPTVMYLQRDDESDTTWMMYIWSVDKWIPIGDTEVDLSNYWSKDDVDEMKEALGVPEMVAMTEAQITAAVDKAFTATSVLNPPLTGISISNYPNGTLTVGNGETCNLKVVAVPATAILPKVNYMSSDETVVTVDSTGKLTSLVAGTATVTITTEDGKFTTSLAVTVNQLYVLTVVHSVPGREDVSVTHEPAKFAGDICTVKVPETLINEGYTFKAWMPSDENLQYSTGADNSISFAMPASDLTLTLEFNPKVENINAENF